MKKLIYILIFIPTLLLAQKQKVITGNVTDKTKMPIIGASVYVSSAMIGNETKTEGVIESSMLGTTTDFDGNFTLKVSDNIKSILISYIGYETEKVDISTKTKNIFIVLKQSSQALEEVVLTGYQKIEKRKMTSAYAKVEMSDINQAGVANVDQMLAGQISGVLVQPTNGAPGAPSKISIRGTATLNGSSDPLWVLDGIPLEGNEIPKDFRDKDNIDNLQSYPIAGLNPDDIESITVLKDASATSIYGARAANGVIVITSKKGKKGSMRVNANANVFITQKPDFSKLNLMDSSQKVDFELLLASRSDLKYKQDRGDVARILNNYGEYNNFRDNGFSSISTDAQNEINNLKNTNTTWGDELYQMALNQQYSVGISGGSENNNYYFSTGIFDEKGSTKGTGQKRYNITLKDNISINNKLNVGIALFGSQNRTSSYITGADSYTNPSYYSRNANPYLKIKDENGAFVYDPDLLERDGLNLNYNILEERQNTNYELVSNSLKSIFDVDYKLNKDIYFTTQLGLQLDFDNTEKFSDEQSFYTRKYEQKSQYSTSNGYDYFMPKGGIIQNWNADGFQYNWKTMANYNTKFNRVHELDIMLGTEFRRNKRTEIHTKGFGFNPNTLTTILIANELALKNPLFNTYGKTYSENAYASFFGTASYTYDKKYTVFTSLRYDGSNLFGVNPKYRYLPIWSFAGSWNVYNEDFMFDVDAVSDLKLRASYGVQGNIDKSTSPFVLGTYDTASILPEVNEEVIRALSAPNGNLRWEKTVSSNVGVDLGLLKNRIYITGDYYTRKSTDLIGLRAVPLESGYNFINTNWATVTNKGFELSVNTTNINTPNFKWTSGLNISHNKSIVNDIEIRENDFKPSLKGYSVNAIFAIKTAGLDSNGLPLFWKNGKKVSAVDFYNLEEGTDGTQLTRQEHRNLYSYVGDGTPKFSGGFRNSFKYKQFDLRVLTNFNIKQTVKSAPTYMFTQAQPGKNYNTDILKAGTGNYPALIGFNSPGFDTDLVYNWFNSFDDGKTYNDLDIWVKDISYIRVSSVKLSYALPKKQLEKLHLSSLNFNIEGRNLFVLGTDHDGFFDPETYGSLYAQPIPRIISAGFNISF
ncbi:SusC/RagA family TonB-linked outer membrane protein [Wenyingzhuangia marina]|uniref:TonB-linked outer membrane protein, SusC/RagA family n=1 Tax=Wenyingzhuangia marina TaxID=1195760 RepID=A0A1M5VH64_9FLAO|nr:SusC/RagA family TonB-linked outer membrane protein [Wenyingzhuangia marina]GGF72287.1 SusC/RagA family TonB-linked outer membrane protein [Wenyingzhuangia marina]SHH74434.1 TonB-linked outer membrane protein, SusC/RagA family [Wenyingzhuangia marina]